MIFLFHHHSTCPAWEPLIIYRKICVTTITCTNNMFLPSITAVLTARAQVTVRHGGHDELYSTTNSLLTSTGSTYPSNSTTAGQSKVTSQLPLPCNATATSILPLPSNYGSRNPYTNATFLGGRHESASHTSPTQELPPVTTAPWNELWSLHWPSSNLLNSSSTPNTPLLNVTPILAIPTTTACPDQSSQSPYITMSMASSTTTLRATSSPTQGTHNAPVQPIIYNPGLLPTPDTLTSTIHITVTVSGPSPSPTESPLHESTITSTIHEYADQNGEANSGPAFLNPSCFVCLVGAIEFGSQEVFSDAANGASRAYECYVSRSEMSVSAPWSILW
jgi:hypothetical protein